MRVVDAQRSPIAALSSHDNGQNRQVKGNFIACDKCCGRNRTETQESPAEGVGLSFNENLLSHRVL